jgi:hypothetical protein
VSEEKIYAFDTDTEMGVIKPPYGNISNSESFHGNISAVMQVLIIFK